MHVNPPLTVFWDGQTGVTIKCNTSEETLTSLSLQKKTEKPNTVQTGTVEVQFSRIVCIASSKILW